MYLKGDTLEFQQTLVLITQAEKGVQTRKTGCLTIILGQLWGSTAGGE